MSLANELKSRGKLITSLEHELETTKVTLEKTIREHTAKIDHLESISEKRIKETQVRIVFFILIQLKLPLQISIHIHPEIHS